MSKEKECNQLKQKILSIKKELDETSSLLVISEYNHEKDLEDQKLRSHQEIQTLQQIIQETCDESALANNEIKKLAEDNERMRQEMFGMKEMLVQQQQVTVWNSFLNQHFINQTLTGFQQNFRSFFESVRIKNVS